MAAQDTYIFSGVDDKIYTVGKEHIHNLTGHSTIEQNTYKNATEEKVIPDLLNDIPKFHSPPLEDQYDAVLIYCEKDEREALLFKDIIEKNVVLKDGDFAKIYALENESRCWSLKEKCKQLKEVLSRSTYVFLFLTDDFLKDTWTEWCIDNCMQESTDDIDRKWSVVPIHTIPKQGEYQHSVPWTIKCLKGLHIDAMLKGKKLSDITSLDDVTAEDYLDPFVMKLLRNMMNAKLHLKTKRKNKIMSMPS